MTDCISPGPQPTGNSPTTAARLRFSTIWKTGSPSALNSSARSMGGCGLRSNWTRARSMSFATGAGAGCEQSGPSCMNSTPSAVNAGRMTLALEPTPGDSQQPHPRGVSVFLRQWFQYYCGLCLGRFLARIISSGVSLQPSRTAEINDDPAKAGMRRKSMKVFLRNAQTGWYYPDPSKWTPAQEEALDLAQVARAVERIFEAHLENVEILLCYDDPRYDLILPVPASPSHPESSARRQSSEETRTGDQEKSTTPGHHVSLFNSRFLLVDSIPHVS